MKNYLLLFFSILIFAGCSAKVKFVNQQNGETYYGKTGSTATSSGNITANIENEEFAGEWIYSSMGGGYSIGTMQTGAIQSFGTGISAPIQGNGLVTMKGLNGGYVRCVYNFSAWTSTGTGICNKNDGKTFDVFINK